MRGDTFKSHLQARFAKCICDSCKRRGCKLGLGSLPSHSFILIDADKYKECCKFRGRLCDYILFYLEGSPTIAVVELKSGLIEASKAQKQIENGSKVAEQVTGAHLVSNFLPILLHRRPIHSLDIKTLRKARVPFQGKNYMIIIERCGSQFRGILSKYSSS